MDGCRVSIMANSSTVVKANVEDVCGVGEMEMISMFCANMLDIDCLEFRSLLVHCRMCRGISKRWILI